MRQVGSGTSNRGRPKGWAVALLAVAATAWAGGGPGASAAAPRTAAGGERLLTTAKVRIGGGGARDMSGFSVAGAGDVNGDGRDDVIIGAPSASANGRFVSGSAFVVFGSPRMRNVTLDRLGSGGFRIDGASVGDVAGTSVAGAGDVDGDGRDDVIVGAPGILSSDRRTGAAFVIFGSSSHAPVDLASIGSRAFRIGGGALDDRAGYSVAGAGDLDGDGHRDLVIGAPGASAAGAAYVVFGSADRRNVSLGSLGARGFRIDGAGSDQAGSSVAGAGDVNGDGRDDFIVGAPGAQDSAGSAFVIGGSRRSRPLSLHELGGRGLQLVGRSPGDGAGSSVAGAGDVNGDGRDDLLVGAPGEWNGRRFSGTAYLVYGAPLTTRPVHLGRLGARGFRITAAAGASIGNAVGGAGDVNGDRLADVVVGGSGLLLGGGRAFVLYGSRDPRDVDTARLGTRGFRIRGLTGGNPGFAVAGAGDLNGDRRADVVVGAPGDTAFGRTGPGVSYLPFGFDRLAVRRFRVSPSSVAVGDGSTLALPLAIRWTLNRPARVTIRLAKGTSARPRPGGKPARVLRRSGRAGANVLRVAGRVDGSALSPGRWTATIVAADETGATAPQVRSFTILPR